MNKKIIKVLSIIAAVIGILVCGTLYMNKSAKAGDTEFQTEEDTEAITTAYEETSDKICVYVCGEVVSPGIFYLDEGCRIWDAIQAAGGTTEDADTDGINQAELLTDSEKVYVPGQSSATIVDETSDPRININTADAEELMQLTGIGQSRADSIISYREENGEFQAIEDIMNVPGIKEAAFSKIKDDIRVR